LGPQSVATIQRRNRRIEAGAGVAMLSDEEAADWRRLRPCLMKIASAYAGWSAVCLSFSCTRLSPVDLAPVPVDWLRWAGGPPLLLWDGFDGAWLAYGVLTLVVFACGGGAMMMWRTDAPLSLLTWLWTMLAWCSAGLLLWVGSF
jgi:hypothetical protein